METVAGTGNTYHLLNETKSGSRCGSIQIESRFGRHAHEMLKREEAEQQGLEPCLRCQSYTGEK